MMKGLKVGAYVNVLPSHRDMYWVELTNWPAKVVRVLDNGNCPCFELENCQGTWSGSGLVVINRQLENK